MKILPAIAILLTPLLLSSCAAIHRDYQTSLTTMGVTPPSNRTFESCRGYGCKFIDPITFSDKDWRDIHAAFTPKPKTAEQERTAIAKTIGIFETKIGEINGTSADIHGTFMKLGLTQQDCSDESINTTTYLALLKQEGLLPHHEVQATTDRIPLLHFIGRWPHKTAVIKDTESENLFAVDSWFHDNGTPAEILPLDEWRSGWRPEGDENRNNE